MLGERLGHYRVLEELGAGGMGVVYKARDERLERDVALKLIRPEWTSPTLQAAFLREARLASSLNHPGIVTIYDILHHPQPQGELECIVMEYVPGAPLSRAIPPQGLPPERVLALGLQIAEALAAAHAAGVVHRDLKPANILLRQDGQVKILDFGLAKLVGGGPREDAPTQADPHSIFGDRLIGTLAYMAPEQARGEALDQRADLFSFGAILYQMLAGRPPFAAETSAALLYAVQMSPPAPLAAPVRPLPPGLEALVLRALAKSPAQRFADATEMASELRRLAGGEARTAAAAPELGAASAGAAPDSVRQPPSLGSEKSSIAVLAFRSLSPNPDDTYLAAGLAAEILTALTGVPGLRIAPRVASLDPRLQEADPLKAAHALAVRYTVSGTLRRAGSRIRVNVELTDAQLERLSWSQHYDREVTDIFAIQEEISQAIARSLGGQLIREASEFAFRSPLQNLDAWGLVRKAYHLWNYAFSLAGVTQALELLRRAIALEPNYAPAHAYLGFYLSTTVINRLSSDLEADRASAQAEAALACQLAPEDPEVLESAALVWVHSSQYEKAVHCLRRAVRLAPFDLVAWGYLGFAHACAGGPAELAEARDILARLIADAPEHPSFAFWNQFLAIACLRVGDGPALAAAVEHGRRAFELQPGFVFNQVFYAEALARSGREAEAGAVMASIAGYNPHFSQSVFEDVAFKACRSSETVEQLCGKVRSLHLFPA